LWQALRWTLSKKQNFSSEIPTYVNAKSKIKSRSFDPIKTMATAIQSIKKSLTVPAWWWRESLGELTRLFRAGQTKALRQSNVQSLLTNA